jgi:hypothetical protein
VQSACPRCRFARRAAGGRGTGRAAQRPTPFTQRHAHATARPSVESLHTHALQTESHSKSRSRTRPAERLRPSPTPSSLSRKVRQRVSIPRFAESGNSGTSSPTCPRPPRPRASAREKDTFDDNGQRQRKMERVWEMPRRAPEHSMGGREAPGGRRSGRTRRRGAGLGPRPTRRPAHKADATPLRDGGSTSRARAAAAPPPRRRALRCPRAYLARRLPEVLPQRLTALHRRQQRLDLPHAPRLVALVLRQGGDSDLFNPCVETRR